MGELGIPLVWVGECMTPTTRSWSCIVIRNIRVGKTENIQFNKQSLNLSFVFDSRDGKTEEKEVCVTAENISKTTPYWVKALNST